MFEDVFHKFFFSRGSQLFVRITLKYVLFNSKITKKVNLSFCIEMLQFLFV